MTERAPPSRGARFRVNPRRRMTLAAQSKYCCAASMRPPAHTRTGSTDRMMDRDELRSVRERPLDLHLVDHLGHAFHDVVAPEDRLPGGHQLGNGATVTDAFEDLGGDERDRLGMVELEAPGAPAARHLGRGEDQELLLLPGREVHRRASFLDC